MSDEKLTRLQARLDDLDRRLASLERRFGESTAGASEVPPEIEARPTSGIAAHAAESVAETGVATPASAVRPDSGTLPLIGRTLLVMGGAFLLRAATDGGTLPPLAGASLGILYGAFWLFCSQRAASNGDPRSATFHGIAAALVIFPLLVESTLKFQILPPIATATVLSVLWMAGMVAAYQQQLRPLAWIFCIAGGIAGHVLTVGSGFYPPFAWVVLGIALGGLWLGYLRAWGGLAVVGSVVADFIVLATTLLFILRPEKIAYDHLTPTLLFSLQLGLIVLYLVSYLVRALFQHEHVSVLEILQAMTAFVIGGAGALYVTRIEPRFSLTLGVFTTVIGLLCYVVAFLYVDRRAGRRRNFAFFTSSALVALLIGSTLLLDGAVLTAWLLLCSLAAAALGAHHGRATLSLHGAVYVVGASVASGLIWLSVDAFVGAPATVPSGTALARMIAVILVALACCSARVVAVGPTWGRWSRAPKAINLLVLSIGIGGLTVLGVSRLFMESDGTTFDRGAMAALRTGALAIAATTLGALSRWRKYREAARLVPIFLAFGALTLALGDLRAGRPLTLVFSLVLYGSALIFAPRLAKVGRDRSTAD